ncbi:zinc finger protein KNUCKLES isoform X1 [Gossypium raimondii]|uniref:C2H2-type domain-containing protein n=1 Tax=Gossypium raimondii TaxID=29730 RepID=A0A0D2P8X6_GOSRA|nr:zinc finger protein KNUCKLES isoform X1 [Gossypium raimondii]KJB42237.1 hypothetical protein B456_007G144000 [Gossypium raimondii]
METNHQHEDSKSSSEESDRSEQSNDDVGSGRSYECVFCKRGFTTAQALGGHMNIHRKDRAKSSRPNSVPIVSGKVDDENYASLRSSSSYLPIIQSYQPHYVSYQAFFPASSGWDFRPPHPPHGDELFVNNSSRYLNPFREEDWPRNLNLRIGPSHVDENKKIDHGSSQDDELDLELRLGHDP